MKYDFTSHSKSDNSSPCPLNFFSKSGLSLTELSNTNQCPGGVYESGPSAQYSAKTLV
jgi:hypothetical protein